MKAQPSTKRLLAHGSFSSYGEISADVVHVEGYNTIPVRALVQAGYHRVIRNRYFRIRDRKVQHGG